MGFKPCQEFTGVVIFQLAVSRVITEWGEKWNATLNRFMSMFKFEVLKFFYSTTLIKGVTHRIVRFVIFSTPRHVGKYYPATSVLKRSVL
jgi:hypothetical protein